MMYIMSSKTLFVISVSKLKIKIKDLKLGMHGSGSERSPRCEYDQNTLYIL